MPDQFGNTTLNEQIAEKNYLDANPDVAEAVMRKGVALSAVQQKAINEVFTNEMVTEEDRRGIFYSSKNYKKNRIINPRNRR